MKKSLLALAVLGAFAGAASAQSSVTLYGTIDLNGRYVNNDGSAKRWSMGQDGINSSQLGFNGVEDLGGGLKASFVLLGGVNAETGTTNSKFFNRRATLSLSGNFGEVRLGRDYTPTFWNDTIFDAFGTNGVGQSLNVNQLVTGTYIRADNSIGYFLPAMGGLYGQLMAAASEGGVTNPGRYVGGRLGYAAGPFDIAVTGDQLRFQDGTNPLTGQSGNQTTWGIGGAYDFGVVKVLGYFDRDTQADFRENRYSLSGVVPMGQGEIHVGYERSKLSGDGVSNAISQFALGYVYNLSKRTALYATGSRLSNGDDSTNSVLGPPNFQNTSMQTAPPTFGGKSTGFEFGIRHFF
jgi:predicted porin